MKNKDKNKFVKMIFFIVIIDIIFLLTLEVSLKIILGNSDFIKLAQKRFDPATHSQPTDINTYILDPVVFWKLKPSQKYRVVDKDTGDSYFKFVNSYGFMGEDYSLDSVYDLRILSLGDSCTAGWQVAETYTSILKNMLLEKYPNKNILAINAGVSGYTSYQGLKFFEKNISVLKPDLLLVHFGHNDWSDAILNIEDKKHNYFNFWYLRSKKIIKKSCLFLALYEIVYNLKKKTVSETPIARVNIHDYKKNLSGIYLLAERFKIPVIFINSSVVLPEKDLNTKFNLEYIQRLSNKYACALQEVVDTFDNAYLIDVLSLAKEMGNSKFYANYKNDDIWHPGQLGHRRIAEEILRTVEDNKLIKIPNRSEYLLDNR